MNRPREAFMQAKIVFKNGRIITGQIINSAEELLAGKNMQFVRNADAYNNNFGIEEITSINNSLVREIDLILK